MFRPSRRLKAAQSGGTTGVAGQGRKKRSSSVWKTVWAMPGSIELKTARRKSFPCASSRVRSVRSTSSYPRSYSAPLAR